jgi:hypothetical protein
MTVIAENKIQDLNFISDQLRDQMVQYAKDFKRSWINLGQTLYTVYRDKLFYAWGYEKFEYYTEQEIGLKKQLSMKLLKTYQFLEEEEPEYLKSEYPDNHDALQVPQFEAVDVLRLAKRNRELDRADYIKLKKDVFENGKNASLIRKDLTTLIKERKQVDPEEERDKRNFEAIKKFVTAINNFKKEMEALKLISNSVVEEAEQLRKKLEAEIP